MTKIQPSIVDKSEDFLFESELLETFVLSGLNRLFRNIGHTRPGSLFMGNKKSSGYTLGFVSYYMIKVFTRTERTST